MNARMLAVLAASALAGAAVFAPVLAQDAMAPGSGTAMAHPAMSKDGTMMKKDAMKHDGMKPKAMMKKDDAMKGDAMMKGGAMKPDSMKRMKKNGDTAAGKGG